MDTSKREWWRQSDGAQQGPATAEEMKALIGCRALNGASLVWREGMPAWMPLQATDLRDALRKEPVASPTMRPDGPEESGKWYNKRNRLWLSLLFWPLTVYGVYKTSLLEPKTKKIIAGACAVLLLLGILGKGADPIYGRYECTYDGNRDNTFFELFGDGRIHYHSDDHLFNYTFDRYGTYTISDDHQLISTFFRDGDGPYSLKLVNESDGRHLKNDGTDYAYDRTSRREVYAKHGR